MYKLYRLRRWLLGIRKTQGVHGETNIVRVFLRNFAQRVALPLAQSHSVQDLEVDFRAVGIIPWQSWHAWVPCLRTSKHYGSASEPWQQRHGRVR